MFGKVLLLALACVAATEVLEGNLDTIIEEALKEVKVIHDRTLFTVNNALCIYYDNDLALVATVREQVRIAEIVNERNNEMINGTAERLMIFAHQKHAKEEVYLCILNRRENAAQELNNAVSNYDKTATQTGDVERQELYDIAFELFKVRADILFNDSLHSTRTEIMKCKTPECVQEIVTRYRSENAQIIIDANQIILVLNANTGKSKTEIRNTLNSAKRDLSIAKGKGMNAMRACFFRTD